MNPPGPHVRICFVCLGNICRSPTAEAVMRALVGRSGLERAIEIDSAGTGDWHAGEPPDERATAAGKRRGVSLGGEARQFRKADFDRFDYVVGMDTENGRSLEKLAKDLSAREKISLLRRYERPDPKNIDVPDPYYGGDAGFDEVIDICERGCAGLLAFIRERHGL